MKFIYHPHMRKSSPPLWVKHFIYNFREETQQTTQRTFSIPNNYVYVYDCTVCAQIMSRPVYTRTDYWSWRDRVI